MIAGKVSTISSDPTVHKLDWMNGTYRLGIAAATVPTVRLGDDVVVLPAVEHAALIAAAGPQAIPDGMRLCYIEGSCAWFTSQPLERQWGDDWDDAPYEYNAGAPYPYYEAHDAGKEPWALFKLRFDYNTLSTPADAGQCVSVQDINRGLAPWLIADGRSLHAGASPAEFIEFVRAAGGEIYLPVGGTS